VHRGARVVPVKRVVRSPVLSLADGEHPMPGVHRSHLWDGGLLPDLQAGSKRDPTKSGKVKTCRGVKCVGNGPEDASTLKYGKSITVGPFRCTSLERGMRCVVARTGRGFELSKQGVRRL